MPSEPTLCIHTDSHYSTNYACTRSKYGCTVPVHWRRASVRGDHVVDRRGASCMLHDASLHASCLHAHCVSTIILRCDEG